MINADEWCNGHPAKRRPFKVEQRHIHGHAATSPPPSMLRHLFWRGLTMASIVELGDVCASSTSERVEGPKHVCDGIAGAVSGGDHLPVIVFPGEE
jgi:hypothetical protein